MIDKSTAASQVSEHHQLNEKTSCREIPLITGAFAEVLPEESRQMFLKLIEHQNELEVENEALRRSQKNLAASREYYSDLFSRAPISYCVVNQRAEVIYANLATAKMLNISESDLVGRPLSSFIFAADQQIYADHRNQLLVSGKEHRCELRLVRQGQPPFWARLIENLSEGEGSDQTGRLVIRDMSQERAAREEQEKLHNQLVQAVKMEAVGQLAGGVAHELNNMLAVILGYSEITLELLEGGSELHSPLLSIHKAAQHSANLTGQLLTFARRQVVLPEVVDLNQIISRSLTRVRQLVGPDIELSWQPGEDLAAVKIDLDQFDQLIVILANNARDAIGASGTLGIATANVRLTGQFCSENCGATPGEYVRLTVSDSGCGIVPEALPHLFEPFYTTKEIGEGVGLGLSVAYGIIKQNGGYIAVSSHPGQGSVFDLYFPRWMAGKG